MDALTAQSSQALPSAYPERVHAPREILDRGRATYGVNCGFCHGSDAGGGEVGPNLLRSEVVLRDKGGELIGPIVHGSRLDRGMPGIDLSDAQIKDIADWLHSLKIESHTLGSRTPINIVVGDAGAGTTFFAKTCASCHSPDGDLKGIATRFPDPRTLQQAWLLPGAGIVGGLLGPHANPTLLHVPPVTVTVSPKGGQAMTGELSRIDDFFVSLKLPDGTLRSFRRLGNEPKVEVHDPVAPHRALLPVLTDKQMHDITAYLVTLK